MPTRFNLLRTRLLRGLGKGGSLPRYDNVSGGWLTLICHEDMGYIAHTCGVVGGDRPTKGNLLLWEIMQEWIGNGGDARHG